MRDSSHRYLHLRSLLTDQVALLERTTLELRDKDRRKFAQLRRRCRDCDAPLDWYALLGGESLRPDPRGDFDVTSLVEIRNPMRCPSCRSEVGFDLLFRRGASELSDQRRQIFDDCKARLSDATDLTPPQIERLLRFMFRHAIVRSVVDLDPVDRGLASNAIELVDVHRTYEPGATAVVALRDVHLSIAKGEFAALVGASGAGKSTLLNTVGCIDKPTSGRVLIDGIDAGDLPEGARAELRNRKIGFIFQTFNLLPVLNVFENVELPLLAQRQLKTEGRRERVRRAIESVGLDRFVEHKPDQLSGGQRQRVAIARALVIEPAIIVADEPTANLDSSTAHQIVNLMVEMNELFAVTFLFSTHDERLISRMRRVITISDGQVVGK